MSEILGQIQKIPQDPAVLGVSAARGRLKEFGPPFQRKRFQSLDGTPLMGGMAIHQDEKPRPGVVLAHGFTETKNQKYLVEVSTLLYQNGWHVVAIDLRGHGESRQLSQALITSGWKEADDILAAAQLLRNESRATSVAVLGFSMGGRSAAKAMIKDQGQLLQAGMGLGAPIGQPAPLLPPDPNVPATPIDRFFLGFLGAPSFFEYYERSAKSYGVTREFLEGEMRADTTISQVKAPLLLVSAFDDLLWLAQIRRGRHEGGNFSLRYRDAVKDHPHIGTLLLDRGDHAGRLYLSDPHWFGTMVLTYLKYWQGPQADHVTVQVPIADLLLEGRMETESATYRVLVRNHGKDPLTNVKVYASFPPDAKVLDCWAGVEGLNRCGIERDQATWTIPRLSGGKSTAGPFVSVVSTAALKPGKMEVKAWIDAPGAIVQEVTLEKK
ncbi:MAG TPA: alpha/beta fold hydrolase [Methylomirabilota bacterium]|jgi:pimeloyl-ACP methyl ester carboxylesterase|nr:alpha/beta fold hydrolase [Methylomirabilota bacterium]